MGTVCSGLRVTVGRNKVSQLRRTIISTFVLSTSVSYKAKEVELLSRKY